jgi:hypothetical protein
LALPKKLLFAIALPAAAALALYAQAPAPPAKADPVFAALDEIMVELSRISGLKPLGPVEYDMIPRERVKPFLEARVNEVVKPEEIRAEETALKKFGFAPPDFDLAKTTVDLLSEQVAAFYDFRKKKLFMIDAGSDMLQHSALVHELAHALADQHFHLEKFIDRAAKNDDGSLARLAVMEGQATWLMSEYLTQRTGQSLKDAPVLVKLMSHASDVPAGQFPVFDRAPLYLRETLLFPYTQGMLFQHAVVEKLDKAAFAEVFRRPPTTTQQILHPDMYFHNVKAMRPALPAIEDHRNYRTFTDGEVGELDHSILLRQYAGREQAAAIAPEWRGGVFRLLESRRDKRMVLAYASTWSGPEAARKYFALYQKVLAGKWKTFEVASRGEDLVAGRGDDGFFLLRRDGSCVTSLEGMASPKDAVRIPQATGLRQAVEPAIH